MELKDCMLSSEEMWNLGVNTPDIHLIASRVAISQLEKCRVWAEEQVEEETNHMSKIIKSLTKEVDEYIEKIESDRAMTNEVEGAMCEEIARLKEEGK